MNEFHGGDEHADLRQHGRLLWAAETDRATTVAEVQSTLSMTLPRAALVVLPDDGSIDDWAAENDGAPAVVLLYDEGGMPTAVLEILWPADRLWADRFIGEDGDTSG